MQRSAFYKKKTILCDFSHFPPRYLPGWDVAPTSSKFNNPDTLEVILIWNADIEQSGSTNLWKYISFSEFVNRVYKLLQNAKAIKFRLANRILLED